MKDRKDFEKWHNEHFPLNSLMRFCDISETYADKETKARFEMWGFIHPSIAQLESQLAAEKERADSNERMFHAACEDLGLLSEAFDIDSNIDGGAEPILEAIDDLKDALEEARKLAATDELRVIGELLRNQDDQCTADPTFIVERKCIVTGFDTDYCESHQIVWAIEDSMYFESDDYFKELEEEFERTGKQREDHTRTGFIVHWDFVQLFFTQSAADELISKHGHKYGGELRVSVESAYRNIEFQTVRNWLMSLPSVDVAIKGQQ